MGDVSIVSVLIFGGFVAFVIGLSLFLGGKAKSSKGYFAAGGTVPWGINGISFAGDYLSAASFLGICGMLALKGYDGFLYSIGYLAGWIVALFVVAEPMKRLGKYTFTDALDSKFGSRPLRLAAAVGAALVSPADGQSAFVLPTVTWDANHNEAFQIQFSANDFLGEPLIVVANDDDAEDSTADFGITRTSFTIPAAIWSNVEALVAPGTDGTGIVYFAVRGQDALARTSISEVRSLRVNATGTAVNNPPPKKKSGGGGFSLIWLLILAALSMIRGASPSGTAPRKS